MHRPPLTSNRLVTSSIDSSKHSFAIKPYIPRKKGLASSTSTSPLVNKSEDHKPLNGSKALGSRKHPQSSRVIRTFDVAEDTKGELGKRDASYKNLKKLFNKLKANHETLKDKEWRVQEENQSLKKDVQQLKCQSEFYQQQFDRIKRECLKLLEIEGFKNKKMEQTLQEKELMIQYLKGQVEASQDETSKFGTHSHEAFQNQFANSLRSKNRPVNNNTHNSILSLASLEDILAIQAAEKDRFLHNSVSDRDQSNFSLNFSKEKSSLFSHQSAFNSHNESKQETVHKELAASCNQNVSFSLNQPTQVQQRRFTKNKPPEIDVEEASTIEIKQLRRKTSCVNKSKRKKSETEDKLISQINIRSRFDNADQHRKVKHSVVR